MGLEIRGLYPQVLLNTSHKNGRSMNSWGRDLIDFLHFIARDAFGMTCLSELCGTQYGSCIYHKNELYKDIGYIWMHSMDLSQN